MKTILLQVGQTQDRRLTSLIADYASRIGHYMPFEMRVVSLPKSAGSMPEAVQRRREGELLLGQVADGDTLVLLDERGDERRSVDFASWLQKKANTTRRMVFAIGGPYGFSDDVYRRADSMISLSRMTFSHQMVRLVFTEQLYRACTILRGEPYHHE